MRNGAASYATTRATSSTPSFTLPVEIDEAASAAKFEDGVLELTLAKKAANVGRRLTIQ